MELGAFSVSLAVKDLQASQRFYETLGFRTLRPGQPGASDSRITCAEERGAGEEPSRDRDERVRPEHEGRGHAEQRADGGAEDCAAQRDCAQEAERGEGTERETEGGAPRQAQHGEPREVARREASAAEDRDEQSAADGEQAERRTGPHSEGGDDDDGARAGAWAEQLLNQTAWCRRRLQLLVRWPRGEAYHPELAQITLDAVCVAPFFRVS